MRLLAVRSDPRTVLSEALGILTGIMYLAPVDTAGRGNLCAGHSPACAELCLFYCGRGGMAKTQEARVRKTQRLFDDRDAFFRDLNKDIASLHRKADKLDMVAAVRLNGTTDCMWEKLKNSRGQTIISMNPDTVFYDYTKLVGRMMHYLGRDTERGHWPSNYSLTFSRSELNGKECKDVLRHDGTVAVVYGSEDDMPETEWGGYPVIPEVTDFRPADPPGTVVGLVAKGRAKKDTSGFVVRNA